ncbi:SAM-dependent methyltransferase [Rosistilla oblonga]|uniref:SAM-dependent methyltransferase n=1 Tax=Rosistilla oblonga TaxID=2527990 RepID=UPI003A97EEBB
MSAESLLQNYQLIDFGDGRKLESIDGYKLDRPSPAAEWDAPAQADAWQQADAVYDGSSWTIFNEWPESLELDTGAFRLAAEPKPFGHIGFFPEQAANWQWLASLADRLPADCRDAMNLFGYTGGSTLALARVGFRVAHIDASKPSVARTGDNARRSELGDAAIRYIVEDARRFAAREIRRGRKHSVIVLDPPAYGHGTKGDSWRIQRDLWPLLEDCLSLLTPRAAMLITGHSDTICDSDISDWLRQNQPAGLEIDEGRCKIPDSSGRSLDAGYFVRATWHLDSPSTMDLSDDAN